MDKVKRPVSVAGIEFDALISSEYTLEATVPAYAVEDGYAVSDTIILNPEKLQMVLYLTNTPVTWYAKHGNDPNRVETICNRLEELYFSRALVQVITSEKTYDDMAIESITISKTVEDGYAREIPISFCKVRKTTAQTTTIPSSYGKSGATGAAAGTANTSTGTPAGGSSGSGSSGSSSSNSGSSGSILYNLGKNAGLIKP